MGADISVSINCIGNMEPQMDADTRRRAEQSSNSPAGANPA